MKRILMGLLVLASTHVSLTQALSFQSLPDFLQSKPVRVAGGAIGAIGASYLLYQLLFMQTEFEKARCALQHYLWHVKFVIHLRQDNLDLGRGYCEDRFNELKPLLTILRDATLKELGQKVIELDIAFAKEDDQQIADAYAAIKKFIEIQCKKELDRKARLHKRKKTYLEIIQYKLHRIGVNTLNVIGLYDEDN